MTLALAVLAAIVAFVLGVALTSAVAARRARAAGDGPIHPARVTESTLTAAESVPGPVARASARTTLAPRILGAIDVGVVVMDRDETAIYANRAAREIRAVVDDRLTSPALVDLLRTVTDTGEASSATVDVAGGHRVPDTQTFVVTAMPLDAEAPGERVTSVLLRFTDITETRRLERVRRDFVANVSHELKTPVGALTLLAEAVQDAADDPEAVQRFSDRMQVEGARLGRLVQELIELSRLQGAEPLPGSGLVEVEDILGEAVDRSRLAAERTGITVVERCEPGLQVAGNETQLATAVANLVDNAIAYSPERTKVGVSARSITETDGRRWVEIAVTDQGIGIAEADLDRVFERFFRVDPARSRATGGTGLGLAIVKHIASNHGGSVSVWSVAGSGSTFTIRIPLAGNALHIRAVDDDTPAERPAAVPDLHRAP